MQIVDKERIYYSALYDYAYLKKHFIESQSYHVSFAVHWDIINMNGQPDGITDSVPFPDLFHHLQFSHSFIEKTSKYLLSLYDSQVTLDMLIKYNHKLPCILDKLTVAKSDWKYGLNPELEETLKTIANIKFPSLRYSKPQIFIVNFHDLKRLLDWFFKRLKEKRFDDCYSDPTQAEAIQAAIKKDGRIKCHIERKAAPKRFDQDRFHEVISSAKLNAEQKTVIEQSYIQEGTEMLLKFDEHDIGLLSALETGGVDTFDAGIVRFEIT
jgi:hypothetical protein